MIPIHERHGNHHSILRGLSRKCGKEIGNIGSIGISRFYKIIPERKVWFTKGAYRIYIDSRPVFIQYDQAPYIVILSNTTRLTSRNSAMSFGPIAFTKSTFVATLSSVDCTLSSVPSTDVRA